MTYRHCSMAHKCLITMRHNKYDVSVVYKRLSTKFIPFNEFLNNAVVPSRLIHNGGVSLFCLISGPGNIDTVASLQIGSFYDDRESEILHRLCQILSSGPFVRILHTSGTDAVILH